LQVRVLLGPPFFNPIGQQIKVIVFFLSFFIGFVAYHSASFLVAFIAFNEELYKNFIQKLMSHVYSIIAVVFLSFFLIPDFNIFIVSFFTIFFIVLAFIDYEKTHDIMQGLNDDSE